MVSPHAFFLSFFADAHVQKIPKLHYFITELAWCKLAIGILILDSPLNLAISWPCFKRMVILSITTSLIPYNHFLPFLSLMGTVAVKWTNSSGKCSIHQSIYYESMIENYYSFFSFLSGVNFNGSSQALLTVSRLRPQQFDWISLEPKRRSCER